MKIADVAQKLLVMPETVRTWIIKGELNAVKTFLFEDPNHPGYWDVSQEDFDNYLLKCQTRYKEKWVKKE